MPQFLLLWAAVPAVALSVWLLRIADAPRSVQAMQVATAGVAMAGHVLLMRMPRLQLCAAKQWLALFVAASLFTPLIVGSTGSPARWLVLGNTRLYLAPVVLPLALFLLAAPFRFAAIYAVCVTAVTVALALQPDASQLTAFALALLVLLGADDVPRPFQLCLLGVLLSGVVVTWRIPDPLSPVRYVEGVFNLAADVSPLAFLAAVVFAALPVAALVTVARFMRSRGTLAVAVYFGSLFSLAPLQVTPVPLLGFGSGPILGYFLVAGVVTRKRTNEVEQPA